MDNETLGALALILPRVVRELGPTLDPSLLIAITGAAVAELDVERSPQQLRNRLAAASGAYLRWFYPPDRYSLSQAGFGRLWWTHPDGDVIDIVRLTKFSGSSISAAALAEAEDLAAAAPAVVRIVLPETPRRSRAFVEGTWVSGLGCFK